MPAELAHVPVTRPTRSAGSVALAPLLRELQAREASPAAALGSWRARRRLAVNFGAAAAARHRVSNITSRSVAPRDALCTSQRGVCCRGALGGAPARDRDTGACCTRRDCAPRLL